MVGVSVVIPAFNEEEDIVDSVGKITAYMRSQGLSYEVVVVDDGSSDGTYRIVDGLDDENVRVLKNEVNLGKGYSVRKGVLEAKYEWVLFSDADLATPMEELGEFLKHSDYDVIFGSRCLPDSNIIVHQPRYRELMGHVYNILTQLLVVSGFRDMQCGFKLFKREAAQAVFSKQRLNGFGFDVEVVYLARKYGYRLLEYPVTWRHRQETKVNMLKAPSTMFMDLVRIRLNNLTGKY
jgi:dolichyl-phosphate beta-glucosyltransferase